MDALDVIMTRRSVRQFTDQPVDDDAIEKILKAAMSAPSARNEQPWHFVVINDRNILNKIPSIHPYACRPENSGQSPGHNGTDIPG